MLGVRVAVRSAQVRRRHTRVMGHSTLCPGLVIPVRGVAQRGKAVQTSGTAGALGALG